MQKTLDGDNLINAEPFLKWAGGKRQLIEQLDTRIPKDYLDEPFNYIEPFLGGGAFFFHLYSKYDLENVYLMDINRELIVGYKTVKNDIKPLIKILEDYEEKYLNSSKKEKEELYYKIRKRYNSQIKEFDYENYNSEWINRAAYLIFLNKTCYNGLFRVNQKGEFNVPWGRYKNPNICDKKNLLDVNKALKKVKIIKGDFEKTHKFIDENSLVYLDPPYRPINDTSNFTSYAKEDFDDEDQRRLAKFYKRMDKRNAYLMLSNSDPKNEDPDDDFFENLYSNYNIERVPAKRYINSDSSGRGEINELIITNY